MGLILVLITVLYRGLGGKEETHKGLVLRRALERLYQVWSYCKYLFVVIPVSFSKNDLCLSIGPGHSEQVILILGLRNSPSAFHPMLIFFWYLVK